MINKLILGSRAAKWNVAKLSRLLKVIHIAKRSVQISLGIVLFTTVVQLAYPQQRARPLSKLSGQPIGFWSSQRLQASLQTSSQQPYKLVAAGKNYQIKPSELGITVQVQASAKKALNYSRRQRLKPFSLFRRAKITPIINVDNQRFDDQLTQFAKARDQQPANPVLKKVDGVYSITTAGKTGYKVNQKALKYKLLAAGLGSRLEVPRTEVAPKINQTMLQAAMASWQQQTSKPLSLKVGSQNLIIPISELKEWVAITANQEQSAVLVTYDNSAIDRWLSANAADLLYIPPKSATSYLRDNVVTSSSAGANGQAMDVTKTTGQVTAALQAKTHQATAVATVVSYKTNQIASYSPTSRGLQLLINSWGANKNVAVSFTELGGQGRTASLNSGKQFFAASIYKLYMAHYTYNLIENGQLSPSAPVLATSQTVSSCLEKMIVVSDNDCPLKFANQFGWATVDGFTHQHGFTGTSMITTKTTTADTSKFLTELQAGSLLNFSDTSTLMGYMGRQIFRQAIPSGSPGSAVYDKVGIYNGYWHDAAIVRGPNANYVLVVFTASGGPTPIKTLASQIQQTLAQAN